MTNRLHQKYLYEVEFSVGCDSFCSFWCSDFTTSGYCELLLGWFSSSLGGSLRASMLSDRRTCFGLIFGSILCPSSPISLPTGLACSCCSVDHFIGPLVEIMYVGFFVCLYDKIHCAVMDQVYIYDSRDCPQSLHSPSPLCHTATSNSYCFIPGHSTEQD